jgi:hypothetical protein
MWVKSQINQGKFTSCKDVNCISNLLKVWFRELPQPLLAEIKPESIIACDSVGVSSLLFSSWPSVRFVLSADS